MDQQDPMKTDELQTRQQAALAMGGAEKVQRQQAKGRMSARERIAQLLDPQSFEEMGLLASSDPVSYTHLTLPTIYSV